MNKQTRRNFLKTSLYAGTTVAWTAKSWAQVKGATKRCAVPPLAFVAAATATLVPSKACNSANKA